MWGSSRSSRYVLVCRHTHMLPLFAGGGIATAGHFPPKSSQDAGRRGTAPRRAKPGHGGGDPFLWRRHRGEHRLQFAMCSQCRPCLGDGAVARQPRGDAATTHPRSSSRRGPALGRRDRNGRPLELGHSKRQRNGWVTACPALHRETIRPPLQSRPSSYEPEATIQTPCRLKLSR